MTALLKRIAQLDPTPPWSLGAALLTFVAAFVAIIVGTFFGISFFGVETSYALLVGWSFSMALIVALVLQTRRRDLPALRLAPPALPLPVILLIAFGFAVAIDLIGLAFTGVALPALELLNLTAPGLLDWVFAILFMLLAQPIAEELVFRGVLFPTLRDAAGAWGGLALNALVYALFHLLAYPLSTAAPTEISLWYSLLQPFLAGVVIGAIRAHSGSTRAAIIAHAAFGLFALLKLYVVISP